MRKASPISKSTHVYCILVHRTIQPKIICVRLMLFAECAYYMKQVRLYDGGGSVACVICYRIHVKLSPFILSRIHA